MTPNPRDFAADRLHNSVLDGCSCGVFVGSRRRRVGPNWRLPRWCCRIEPQRGADSDGPEPQLLYRDSANPAAFGTADSHISLGPLSLRAYQCFSASSCSSWLIAT